MSYPTLPFKLPEGPPIDLEEVWLEVMEELTEYKYRNRTHHNPKTYNVGCRGPLCRKALRDYSGRHGAKPWPQHRVLNPVLIFFMGEAKKLIAQDEAEKFSRLIS